VIYIVTLSSCYGSMSCVLCESYTVQNEPGDGCALCDVWRETLCVHFAASLRSPLPGLLSLETFG